MTNKKEVPIFIACQSKFFSSIPMAINKRTRCKRDQLLKIKLDAIEYCFSLYLSLNCY